MAQFDIDERRIARQRAIAQALRESGNQAFDPAASAGRLVYARSPWEDINKIAQQGLAGRLDYLANKQEKNVASQKDAAAREQLAGMIDTLAGKSQMEPTANPDAQLQDFSNVSVRNPVTGGMESATVGDNQQAPIFTSPALTEQNQKRAALAGILKGADPQAAAAALMGPALSTFAPKDPLKLGEGDVLVDPNKDYARIAAGAPKRYKPSDELVDIVDPTADKGYRTISREEWRGEQRYHKPTQEGGPKEPIELMDPETLDLAARDVMQDPGNMRQYASFGQSGQADRTRINNRIASILKDAGMTQAEMTQLRARAKGEIASTTQLTKQINAIESYEKLTKFNGDRLLQLIEGVDETGVPAVEGMIRKAKKAGGSVDTAEFNSVLNSYQTEAARIITQPNLTGVLSDTARKELQEIIAGNLSAPQLRRVVNRINLEMDTRAAAIRQQLQYAGQNMVVAPPAPGSAVPLAPAAAPAPTETPAPSLSATNAKGWVLHEDAQGNKAYVGPNGEIEEVK